MVIDYSTVQDTHTYSTYERDNYFEIMDLTSSGTRVAILITKTRKPLLTSVVVERTNQMSLGWMLDIHDWNQFWERLQDFERKVVEYWTNTCADLDEEKGNQLLKELKHQTLVTRIRERWFREQFAALASQGA